MAGFICPVCLQGQEISELIQMAFLNKYFGPSTLIAAAFIGPGTVTTCTLAGVQAGYTLLWALAFSTIGTIILQEMSARLGWHTGKGLGEAIGANMQRGWMFAAASGLVISAIIIGNGAYEAGNISGGIMGLELLIGESKYWAFAIATLSFVLLYVGKYALVEKVMIGLVLVMSASFLITAVLVKPDLSEVISGLIPNNPKKNITLALSLIGTTIVPYNLFLHASTISKKWHGESSLSDIRKENAVSIALGGLISMLIVIPAGAHGGEAIEMNNARDLAVSLKPLLGNSAELLMGLGLLAAGVTSTLTAPLAAAYAAQGLFGWSNDETDIKFRSVWMIILIVGAAVAFLGTRPIVVIKFAQVANALLLPLIALFLIYVCNSKQTMGQYVNSILVNVLGVGVVVITLILSLRLLNKVLGLF